jgi:hypothetical protein
MSSSHFGRFTSTKAPQYGDRAPETVWSCWQRLNPCSFPWNRIAIIQPIASHYIITSLFQHSLLQQIPAKKKQKNNNNNKNGHFR